VDAVAGTNALATIPALPSAKARTSKRE